MKKLNFNIDIEKCNPLPEVRKAFTEIGVKGAFEQYLNQAISHKHRGGLRLTEGRILARVFDKLDAAQGLELELEEAEFDLIRGAFLHEEGGWQPSQYRVVTQILNAIEKAEKDGTSSASR